MLDWVINSSIPTNLIPNKAASSYTLEPFGLRTTNYNQPLGIDLSLALHKHFLDSYDRMRKVFSLIAIFSCLECNNNKSRFLRSCLTLSRHVKLVDSGTDNISYCLVLYATGSLTFDSIVL